MTKYYLISDLDTRKVKEPHSSQWPKVIAVSVEAQSILLSEGCGHGLSGCTIPINDFNESDWAGLFKTVSADWLLSFIKKHNNSIDEIELEAEISKHRKIELKDF